MSRPVPASDDRSPAPETPLRPGFAARLEDRFHAWRERRARKRGHTPVVIPYTGYGSAGWTRVLCRVLLAKPSPPVENAQARYKKIRGWRSFTSVSVNDVDVIITVEGVEHRLRADRGGIVDAVVPTELGPGWHTVTIRTDESETVEAPVFIVNPDASVGIICDIDDTVMVTSLPRPFLAAWNTFVLDEHARRPVPGMAVLLEKLTRAHEGAPVIYLSTGAWNVAPTLNRFLSRNLYPAGPLLLTDWGPTHDRWFRSGRAHKEQSLGRIAEEFPNLRWILVGDDGQHDEEIYGEFAGSHRQNVAAVAIRQLTGGEAVFAGGRSKPDEHEPVESVPWVYGTDGAGLADHFESLGLL